MQQYPKQTFDITVILKSSISIILALFSLKISLAVAKHLPLSGVYFDKVLMVYIAWCFVYSHHVLE